MRNIFLLVILIGLIFSPCLKADFVNWDDDHHIFNNPQVKTTSLANTISIFQTAVNKTYIPLTTLSFNLEHYFFGLNPLIYHLNNLILHILICLLLYQLFRQMRFDDTTAFLAALLFGIHPIHVESVAWATERKDVLYTFFYVAGLINYCRYIQNNNTKNWYWSLILGYLSLLSKPMALSYPLVLLLFDWVFKRQWNLKLVNEKIPFVLFAPIVWLTYSLNIKPNDHPILESVLIWIWSFSFYLEKFFIPVPLTPLYSLPYPIEITNPQYLKALTIGISFIVIIFLLRKDRWLIFAAGYYFLSIFCVLRTFDVTKNLGPSIVADRFMYLPSLGICLWLALKSTQLIHKNSLITKIVTITTIIFLSTLTFKQSSIWQNDYTLWNHQLKYEQNVPLAHNSYAVALNKRKDINGALKSLDRAIELKPDYARAYYNRGHIKIQLGQHQQALDDLSLAIKYDPTHFGALLDRGTTFGRLGKFNEALNDLNTAAEIEPNNSEVFNNRGIIFKRLGQTDNALRDYNRAIKLNPQSVSTYINRAMIWQELGNQSEAIKDLLEAEKLGFKKLPSE